MPSRRLVAVAVTSTAILAFGPSGTIAVGNPKGKPNILVIGADGLGYAGLGCTAPVTEESRA